MTFNVLNARKTYVRSIESMGVGLVLFKISSADRHTGFNFHYFFEDKKKPTFDLALNPDSGTIEYISFFAQDEKLTSKTKATNVLYKESQIFFDVSEFNEANSSSARFYEFQLQKDSLSNIWALRKNYGETSVNAYNLDENNFLLFDSENKFAGVLLKDLTALEYNELHVSDCL